MLRLHTNLALRRMSADATCANGNVFAARVFTHPCNNVIWRPNRRLLKDAAFKVYSYRNAHSKYSQTVNFSIHPTRARTLKHALYTTTRYMTWQSWQGFIYRIPECQKHRERVHMKQRSEESCIFFRGQLRIWLKLTLVSHKLLISKIRPVFVGSLFLRYGILDLAVDALCVCPLEKLRGTFC